MNFPIDKIRADTPGCADRINLNNAGASFVPTPVAAAISEYLDSESKIGGYETFDVYAEPLAAFYRNLGRLLHAEPRQIAFAGSATDAYARALSAVPFQSGDVILTTEDDYISNQIGFLALQKRFGIRLFRVKNDASGALDLEAFRQQAIRLRPKLVAVTHVPSVSGLVQPIVEVGQICRETNSLYLVDACQSLGQIALDVQSIACDFLSGTMRKFLRGPRGAGFLYVSERVLASGMELMVPDMRGADWTSADTYQAASDARRFEYWEKPYALMAGSAVAADYALTIGLDQIQARVESLAAYTRAQLGKLTGVQVLDKGRHLCGIVTAHAAHWDAAKLVQYLHQHNINARISIFGPIRSDFSHAQAPWALRISPHYYNTEMEIDRCIDVLEQYS